MTVSHLPISPQSLPESGKEHLPPLQNGDRLTRSEFFRRYEAMPPNVKAERIEGIVYMAAAVSADFHGEAHVNVITWLGTYCAATPGVRAADNSTASLDMDNDPQPDACLYVVPSYGGSIKKNPKGYIISAPDLIVEIAASSLTYDLGPKLNVYRRNGVREYLVQRVYDGEFDWFHLHDGEYHRLSPEGDGIIRSRHFPGLWLKVDALIAQDLAEVLTVLQKGIATSEHGEFVKLLDSRRNMSKT